MTTGRNNGRRIVTLAFGLGVMILGAQAMDTGDAQAGGSVHCEIEVKRAGGGVQLQGVVHARQAGSGEYDLEVHASGGGGSSRIRQSGDFSAEAGEAARLGVVQLSTDGGSYEATLSVNWNGETFRCEKRIGGGAL
jgi:hypothetical protein